MKKIFLSLCLLFSISLQAQVNIICKEDLVPKYDTEKRAWGYTDLLEMEFVLEPIYTKVSPFKNNTAVVQKGKLMGVINCNGAVVIPLQYEQLTNFRDEKIWAKKNGVWGLLDSKGNIALSFQYTEINPINHSTLAWVKKNNQWGLVDEAQNKIVCELQYSMTQIISPNASLVKKDNKFGVLNHVNCNYLLPLTADHVKRITQYELLYEENGKWGIFNVAGKMISNAIYDSIGLFQPQVFMVKTDKGLGLVDFNGKTLLPIEYQEIRDFNNGYCVIKKDNKYGYSTRFGKVYIPLQYDNAQKFNQGKAIVQRNGKWGMINIKNEIIVPFEYDRIQQLSNQKMYGLEKNKSHQLLASSAFLNELDTTRYSLVEYNDTSLYVRVQYQGAYYYYNTNTYKRLTEKGYQELQAFSNGYGYARTSLGFGVLNANGAEVVPCEFTEIQNTNEKNKNEWFVKKENAWGLWAENRNVIPIQYSSIKSTNGSLYVVAQNSKWGIINRKNETVLAIQYDNIETNATFPLVVQQKTKMGLVKTDGQFAVSLAYDSIVFLNNNFYKGKKGKSLSIINANFEIIKTKYTRIQPYSEGLMAFELKGKWGYINSKLEESIPAQYEKVGQFNKGIAPVKMNGKVGLISKTGLMLEEPQFDDFKQDALTKAIILIKDGVEYDVSSPSNEKQ